MLINEELEVSLQNLIVIYLYEFVGFFQNYASKFRR